MGLRVSCLDNNRQATVNETIERTYTDDELTVFLANSSFIYPEEVKNVRPNPFPAMKKLEIPKTTYCDEKNKPKCELSTTLSPHPDSALEKKNFNANRIYSSNALENGRNIIETLNPVYSGYSTKVNSKMPSRCMSPSIRSKNTLIE
jgi:hypothetical protein